MVFNFFTKSGSDATAGRYNVLHVADCRWVARMLAGAQRGAPPTVGKVFFTDANEADSWLTTHVGQETVRWKRCEACFARGAHTLSAQVVAAASTTAPAGTTLLTSLSGRVLLPGTKASAAPPAICGFARPEGPAIDLPVQPRLASWNAASDPEQQRLKLYLEATDALLRPHYESQGGPLALRLDVALPQGLSLLEDRDLDNYLYPLAKFIQRPSRDRVTSVWGTKRTADRSSVRIEQARPLPPRRPSVNSHILTTTASPQTRRYKEQIREQVSSATLLPDGPVRLEIHFTVGHRRNWLSLWKPSIDALGQILGNSRRAREWSPRDGRIVELGLHRHIDPVLGNAVRLTVVADLNDGAFTY